MRQSLGKELPNLNKGQLTETPTAVRVLPQTRQLPHQAVVADTYERRSFLWLGASKLGRGMVRASVLKGSVAIAKARRRK